MADDKQVVTKKTAKKKATTKKAAATAAAPTPTPAPVTKKTAATAAAATAPVTKKTAAKKTVAKKAVTKKATASASPQPPLPDRAVTLKPVAEVTPEERYRMIQEAAYYRAERRGFQPGHDEEDWAAAVAEIDAMLHRDD
ncbi:MAG: DUF2934 domain-containing protein [Thiohalocapsa sp.]|uniref:DUF2934 domain-containing protein n=1 Tax=Thiohalocapsa sp. TaxID=2497641 RepID=UPI0025F77E7A|nr:DUF2934 domain-containing protein [Thiohalocapsa sp.]MCG6943669.1 DUF2934 domain-containing protein [Thiohalocapsa sp.]